jgi:AIPR protein
MSIIHVRQIESTLQKLFAGKINIDDNQKKSEQQKNSDFLTRALAAFSISCVADLDSEKAAKSITDDYGDNGIDAIYFDERERNLVLVQTKWNSKGNGSIDRGDALKFLQGIRDLINAKFINFNEKINKRSEEIYEALSDANTKFTLIISYTGQGSIGEDIQEVFNSFLSEMNDPSEVISLRVLKQKDLHNMVVSASSGTPINFDLVMKDWGYIREPYVSYYGRVAAMDISKWMEDYHPRIFDKNIRLNLGITEINQGIVETLLKEPENFWYFNNGLTILCDTIKRKPIGGGSNETGIFECTNISIVNGAQTAGAISEANSKSPELLKNVTAMVRVISLENCPDDFANRVTRATNTQNRVEGRDFISLDPEQERLHMELKIDGIEYAFKAGYSITDKKEGFDLTEATIALACHYSELSYAILAKDKISQLWEDVNKAPYKSLFNGNLSGSKLWTIVKLHRAIEENLIAYKSQGRDSLIQVHGKRFLARQVFRKIDNINFEVPNYEAKIIEIQKILAETTIQAVALTISAVSELYPDSYPANLFRNREKCGSVELFVDNKWVNPASPIK